MKSHGRQENANGARPRHVSGMYLIPISRFSPARWEHERRNPGLIHHTRTRELAREKEKGGRSLRCHLRTQGNPFSTRFAPDPRASRMTTETRERRSRRGWKASTSQAPELSMHSIMVMRPRASLENYVDVMPHPPFAPSSPSPTTVVPLILSDPLTPDDTETKAVVLFFSPGFLSRIHKIQLSLSRLARISSYHLFIILPFLSSFHPSRSASLPYQRLLDGTSDLQLVSGLVVVFSRVIPHRSSSVILALLQNTALKRNYSEE